jgi:hypothetical protein
MEEVAKIFVLLVMIAIAIAFLLRGPAGARAWWRAKFLGQVGS